MKNQSKNNNVRTQVLSLVLANAALASDRFNPKGGNPNPSLSAGATFEITKATNGIKKGQAAIYYRNDVFLVGGDKVKLGADITCVAKLASPAVREKAITALPDHRLGSLLRKTSRTAVKEAQRVLDANATLSYKLANNAPAEPEEENAESEC